MPFGSQHRIGIPQAVGRPFLTRLADAYEEKKVAGILSGTSSDGFYGVQAIHEAGGITTSQPNEPTKPVCGIYFVKTQTTKRVLMITRSSQKRFIQKSGQEVTDESRCRRNGCRCHDHQLVQAQRIEIRPSGFTELMLLEEGHDITRKSLPVYATGFCGPCLVDPDVGRSGMADRTFGPQSTLDVIHNGAIPTPMDGANDCP